MTDRCVLCDREVAGPEDYDRHLAEAHGLTNDPAAGRSGAVPSSPRSNGSGTDLDRHGTLLTMAREGPWEDDIERETLPAPRPPSGADARQLVAREPLVAEEPVAGEPVADKDQATATEPAEIVRRADDHNAPDVTEHEATPSAVEPTPATPPGAIDPLAIASELARDHPSGDLAPPAPSPDPPSPAPASSRDTDETKARAAGEPADEAKDEAPDEAKAREIGKADADAKSRAGAQAEEVGRPKVQKSRPRGVAPAAVVAIALIALSGGYYFGSSGDTLLDGSVPPTDAGAATLIAGPDLEQREDGALLLDPVESDRFVLESLAVAQAPDGTYAGWASIRNAEGFARSAVWEIVLHRGGVEVAVLTGSAVAVGPNQVELLAFRSDSSWQGTPTGVDLHTTFIA